MLLLYCLVILSERPLTILKPILFYGCQLHLSILKSSLVWTSSRIRGWNYVLQSLGEVIQLECKVSEAVLLVLILWVG